MKLFIVAALACVSTVACGGAPGRVATPTPRASLGLRCTGPITIRRAADVRSVVSTCGSIEGEVLLPSATVADLGSIEELSIGSASLPRTGG